MAVNVRRQVLEILRCSTDPVGSCGFLLGQNNPNSVWTVDAYTRCIKFDANDFKAEAEKVQILLAGGFLLCGVYIITDKQTTDVQLASDYIDKYSLNQTLGGDAVIILVPQKAESIMDGNIFIISEEQGVSEGSLYVTDGSDLQEKITVRASCSFQISLQITEKKDSWKKSLSLEISELCDRVRSECAFYHIKDSNVLIGNNQTKGIPDSSNCSRLFDFVQGDGDSFVETRQKRQKNTKSGSLCVSLCLQTSGPSSLRNSLSCAPVIHHKIGNFKSCNMTLPVDVVTVVDPVTMVTDLSQMLSDNVCRQLEAMRTCLLNHTKNENFHVPVPYHFSLPDSQVIMTVLYPKGKPDDQLEGQRRELHRLFGLSEDQPLFRRSNAFMFPEDRASHGYLINPHESISASKFNFWKMPSATLLGIFMQIGVKLAKVGILYLVKGLYSYHHYMQDRFDDDKWGCAYRSLQTLISWFRFQGYTEKAIPTHREIQQALVDVGDKDPKFVGTRKWIGSLEVSYCLDHIIGVTSKIMFVSSGAELASKGRELAMHFETQGTPIMIGGGVLAHTILGIDFDEVTGGIRFLILDPHYTGAEDLKVILDKGWCGWKGADFWDQTAYYNLCLPQRPSMI